MPKITHRDAFGARVRELRSEHGWSQEDFAHRADLDRTYVSGIERGRRNPTLDVIHRLAETLGVPAGELLTEQAQALHADPMQPTRGRRERP